MNIEPYVSSITEAFKPYLIDYYKHSVYNPENRMKIYHLNDGKDFIEKCFESLFIPSNYRNVVYPLIIEM
jgi:hypothetical protein